MAELITNKSVNVSQLGVEMGRIALRCIGPYEDGSYQLKADCTQGELEAAVAAHVADDNWTDPNPAPPTEQQVRAQEAETAKVDMEALRVKAKAVRGGTDTFSAAQLQKLVAALVLRETR